MTGAYFFNYEIEQILLSSTPAHDKSKLVSGIKNSPTHWSSIKRLSNIYFNRMKLKNIEEKKNEIFINVDLVLVNILLQLFLVIFDIEKQP